eukprot:3337131-Amphidinium_carterae.1
MLLQATSGKALTLVMAVEPLNGAAAWASLKKEFRPEIASRHNAMLGLLNPQFVASRPFHEQLAEWKRRIAEYERATSKKFEDDTKIAVLTHASPGTWRSVVIAAAARHGQAYQAVEKELLDHELGSRSFSSLGVSAGDGPTPMEIGAASLAVCQLCGKKGHEAKTCWSAGKGKKGKGEAKGRGKGQKDAKGKGSSSSSTTPPATPPYFSG